MCVGAAMEFEIVLQRNENEKLTLSNRLIIAFVRLGKLRIESLNSIAWKGLEVLKIKFSSSKWYITMACFLFLAVEVSTVVTGQTSVFFSSIARKKSPMMPCCIHSIGFWSKIAGWQYFSNFGWIAPGSLKYILERTCSQKASLSLKFKVSSNLVHNFNQWIHNKNSFVLKYSFLSKLEK